MEDKQVASDSPGETLPAQDTTNDAKEEIIEQKEGENKQDIVENGNHVEEQEEKSVEAVKVESEGVSTCPNESNEKVNGDSQNTGDTKGDSSQEQPQQVTNNTENVSNVETTEKAEENGVESEKDKLEQKPEKQESKVEPAAVSESEKEPEVKGYLQKRTKGLFGMSCKWEKQWFHLKGTDLEYSETEQVK